MNPRAICKTCKTIWVPICTPIMTRTASTHTPIFSLKISQLRLRTSPMSMIVGIRTPEAAAGPAKGFVVEYAPQPIWILALRKGWRVAGLKRARSRSSPRRLRSYKASWATLRWSEGVEWRRGGGPPSLSAEAAGLGMAHWGGNGEDRTARRALRLFPCGFVPGS